MSKCALESFINLLLFVDCSLIKKIDLKLEKMLKNFISLSITYK